VRGGGVRGGGGRDKNLYPKPNDLGAKLCLEDRKEEGEENQC
jgi:hypothetical protein